MNNKKKVCAGLLVLAALAACTTQQVVVDKTSDIDAAAYNLQLGAGYLSQGNLAVAKEKLERARKQNPKDANVRSMLALLYERLDDSKKADTEYRAALRLAPENPDVQNSYAIYLCRGGRIDEGVKYFESAAANRLYRTPWAAYTNAGVCLHNAQRNPEARQRFARALAANPAYDEAAYQMGELELEQGDLIGARTRVDAWLIQNKPTADLLLLGWRVAMKQGDNEAAARYAKLLRASFPDSPQARALAS
ncbi:MAG: type IV pilus biogenesis/stability protein PilW [Steroidobacteraceae bacterium]